MTQDTIELETRHAAPTLGGPILALIPAYDEDRFIASVVHKARRFVDEGIVVDDGSSDETASIAEASGARVLRQPFNQGKAAAFNVGIELARHLDATPVALLDGGVPPSPPAFPPL